MATELEDTARIARDLIRIDTTNWGQGRAKSETEAAEYVEAELASMGVSSSLIDSEPGRTSLIARIPGANPERPALVVHGHLDVVPADPANWSVDPFAGEIRDGMLWGRGAVDMKNMDAMILTSLGDILRSGRQPDRELIVAFFADEENGGVYGSQHLVETRPELFAGATEAISEVGGYSVDLAGRRAYLLQTGEKALVWVKLIARGVAAHGSRLIHDNAVTKLAEAVVKVGRHEWPVDFGPTTQAMLDGIRRVLDASPDEDPVELIERTGMAAGFLRSTLRTTSNPTVLDAGYKHNVIPDRAEALVDIRPFAGREAETLALVQEIVGPEIEIEVLVNDVGLEQPFAGALVDTMVRSLHRHDPGAEVLPYLLSGGTDNKALSALGIAGYGFAPLRLGPGLDFPAMFHGVDERVPLDALAFGRAVLTDFLLEA